MHWIALRLPEPVLGSAEASASATATAAPSPAAPAPTASVVASADTGARDGTPIAAATPEEAPSPTALGWWALRFTPKVAWVDEALLLEVSACERLWGGRRRLLGYFVEPNSPFAQANRGRAVTSLVALALLRLHGRGVPRPAKLPHDLPLDTLTAAHAHLDTLMHLGCRTWGDVLRLPRAGVARRFGTGLLAALDAALGQRPEVYAWLTIPECFDVRRELPALASDAPALMWSAARLLLELQMWLQARQQGVLGFELEWTFDLRRIDGVALPPTDAIVIRTAEPTQDMVHLRRLASEHLGRVQLLAPVNQLRLRSIETTAWGGANRTLLPEEVRKGDALHQMVERLSARLGPQQVLVARPHADHRPEHMQQWLPARDALPRMAAAQRHSAAPPLAERAAPVVIRSAVPNAPNGSNAPNALHAPDALPTEPAAASASASTSPSTRYRKRAVPRPPAAAAHADALYPPWLLEQPQPLEALRDGKPCWHGQPLQLLNGPQRVQSGWWDSAGDGRSTVRDYYIAACPSHGLAWVYCERPPPAHEPGETDDAGTLVTSLLCAMPVGRGDESLGFAAPSASVSASAALTAAAAAAAAALPAATHARAAPHPVRWFLHGWYA